MNKTRAFKRLRPDSGEALLEMALVLPILLVLSMGMLDFGRAFHAKSLVDQAAREGARIAVISGNTAADAQARADDVLRAGGLVGAPAATVSAVDPATHLMTVTVTYNFQFVTPGLFALVGGLTGTTNGGNTIPMTGRARMRLEDGQ